jgi:hypothetical protein
MPFVQAADLAFGVLVGALSTHVVLERRRLRQFVSGLGNLPANPRDLALEVAGHLFTRRHNSDDPPYVLKLFAPLGASPGLLIQRGGCCSGISRLYILALSQLGIPAHQITLYHRTGCAQHCLVEVRLPDGPLIADPLYGLYYTGRTGRAIGLDDLQRGTKPVFLPLPHSDRQGYPGNDYYDFDFTLSKTANWTKTCFRVLTYRFLRFVTGGSVDRLRVPVLFEWPQTLLAILAAMLLAAFHLVVLVAQ